jgi:hypothetical protein
MMRSAGAGVAHRDRRPMMVGFGSIYPVAEKSGIGSFGGPKRLVSRLVSDQIIRRTVTARRV